MEKEGWIAVPCETYLSLRLVQENNTFLRRVFSALGCWIIAPFLGVFLGSLMRSVDRDTFVYSISLYVLFPENNILL